jgi:hypothetical protein
MKLVSSFLFQKDFNRPAVQHLTNHSQLLTPDGLAGRRLFFIYYLQIRFHGLF